MLDHLVFDTTSAQTMADTHSVGAYVRANDGSLITKHSISEAIKAGLITQGLVFKSKLAGAIGNTYSFQVIDSGGSGPLSFTEISGAIVLDLTGLTPTVAQVVAALASNTYADVSAGIPAGNVIVAAAQSFVGGEDTNFHAHLDVYSATADGFGNPISSTTGALDVNIKSSDIAIDVDLNGIYNVSTNPTPDNVGTIMFSRAVTPGLSDQVQTPTVGGLAAIVSGDFSKVHAQDVNAFLYAKNGTSGDMGLLTFDNTDGGLNVHITGSATLTVNDAALADTAIANDKKQLAVAGTAEAVKTSALANRKYLFIYNNHNTKVFIGANTVTAANGFPISPGSYMELRAGANVSPYFVGQTGQTPEIRHMELS